MIAALTYVPRRTPMGRAGALAASAYLARASSPWRSPSRTRSSWRPTPLAVVIAGLLAGTGRALAVSARFAAWLGLLMVVTNAIASQRGETILVRGPDLPVLGTVDVTRRGDRRGRDPRAPGRRS